MSHRILRFPEVKKRTGLAHSTVYRLMDSGDFPKALPLTGRTVGWIESEIDEWVESRIEHARGSRTAMGGTL